MIITAYSLLSGVCSFIIRGEYAEATDNINNR